MAEINPFRGIRYNEDAVASLSTVVAPPYDVISPQERDRLHDLNLHNIVRLILGKPMPGDNEEQNWYVRAAGTLNDWLARRVLVQDPQPALYGYRQEFVDPNAVRRERLSIIAAVRLREFNEGGVLAHEATRAAPKEDRLRLMRACRANLSPILSLCDDASGDFENTLKEAMMSEPDSSAETGNDEIHQLWKIDKPSTINAIQRVLSDLPLYIADGHHRYETALRYRNEIKHSSSSWSDSRPENFIVMAIVDANSPGLVVLPTHRLIKTASQTSHKKFVRALETAFTVRDIGVDELPSPFAAGRDIYGFSDSKGESAPRFVLCTREGCVILEDMNRDVTQKWLDPGMSDAHNALSVTVLHSVIIEGIMREAGLLDEIELDYSADPRDALKCLRNNNCDIVFLLEPTPVASVLAVASAGEKMPAKSTFFYPKLITGVVMRLLEE